MSIILILATSWLPVWQRGMFMDGLIYAVVAHNWYLGLSTVAEPYFSDFIFSTFSEHPPMLFGMLKLFYYLLSDAFWVEKLFSFLSVVPVIGFLFGIGNRLKIKHSTISIAIIFYITTSSISWGLPNNMLENWLSPMALGSVYFGLRYHSETRYWQLVLSGLLITFTFLIKGPVGLFPLATFAGIWLLEKNKKELFNTLRLSLLLTICFAIITATIIFVTPGLWQNLLNYFDAQVLSALAGNRETTSRWIIPIALIKEQLLPIIILVLVTSIQLFRKQQLSFPKRSQFLLFMALAASAPLVISPKQNSFYIIPSIPFYALFFADIITSNCGEIQKKTWHNHLNTSFISVAFITFLIPLFLNKPYQRDQGLLQDLQVITKHVPGNSAFYIVRENDQLPWATIGYLKRFHNINCTEDSTATNWSIIYPYQQLPNNWTNSEIALEYVQLMHKN